MEELREYDERLERWGRSWWDKTEDVSNDGASGGSCLSRLKVDGVKRRAV